jgi:hypothetical protein
MVSDTCVLPPVQVLPGVGVKKKWHYTTGRHFLSIVKTGVINPATSYVPAGEKPIVWFSTNQTWESTATKARIDPDGTIIGMSMAETAEVFDGLVRIGIAAETAPYRWRELKELSGMSGRMAQHLYDRAIECGARPGDWWGTFTPVPRSEWVKIEVLNGGRWEDFDDSSATTTNLRLAAMLSEIIAEGE